MSPEKGPNVTVFMYHDVRDGEKENFFPKRYSLSSFISPDTFRLHLEYIKKTYCVLSLREMISYITQNELLPENSAVLTFDDGLNDHYTNVLPLLNEYDLTGIFFVPSQAVLENVTFDSIKIQFILAGAGSEAQVVEDILGRVHESKRKQLWNKYCVSELGVRNTWTREMVFVTKVLRYGFTSQIRREVIDSLFKKYVSSDEKAFSAEFHLSVEQIKEMLESDMEIGGHGHESVNLAVLTYEEQLQDIEKNKNFLVDSIGLNDLYLSYPNGGYNKNTEKILRQLDFTVAFRTGEDIVRDFTNMFTLPRVDATKFIQ